MTDSGRHLTQEDFKMYREMVDSGTPVLKSVEQGAATQVYAATAPEIAGKGGVYLADCAVCEVTAEGDHYTTVMPYAVDPEAAERLWTVSEQMVGQRSSTESTGGCHRPAAAVSIHFVRGEYDNDRKNGRTFSRRYDTQAVAESIIGHMTAVEHERQAARRAA
ncbi:MAG: hypothetical protein MI724_03485 [Spirochaetales bacterium]|nr:hypothetical protein [Spirochaetales bacterium]